MSLPDELKNRFRIIQFVETEAKALLPAGDNSQIQFNNTGGFGASANLTFVMNSPSEDYLYLTGALVVNAGAAGVHIVGSGEQHLIDILWEDNPSPGTPSFCVTASHVGIGTSTPNYPLEIIAERQQLRIAENDTDNTTFDHRNGRLAISVDGGGDALLIDARHVQVGNSPNSPTAKTAFEVHYSGAEGNADPAAPGNLSDNEGGGEVVYFGSSSAETTQGKLYFLRNDGLWKETTSENKASGSRHMLAISIGTVPNRDGMLIRGFFDVHTYLTGTFTTGDAVYVCPDVGYMDAADPPQASGDYVRVVGHMTTLANVIFFNPGHTYVEIS